MSPGEVPGTGSRGTRDADDARRRMEPNRREFVQSSSRPAPRDSSLPVALLLRAVRRVGHYMILTGPRYLARRFPATTRHQRGP